MCLVSEGRFFTQCPYCTYSIHILYRWYSIPHSVSRTKRLLQLQRIYEKYSKRTFTKCQDLRPYKTSDVNSRESAILAEKQHPGTEFLIQKVRITRFTQPGVRFILCIRASIVFWFIVLMVERFLFLKVFPRNTCVQGQCSALHRMDPAV